MFGTVFPKRGLLIRLMRQFGDQTVLDVVRWYRVHESIVSNLLLSESTV